MVNMDYPGICMACTEEQCVYPADISAYAERVRSAPLKGYTKSLVNALQGAFPDKLSLDEAYMAFDVMKAVVAMGLKNADVVDLEGLGEFRVEKEGGRKKIIFTPERVLADMINE